jgi:hypothetical protein
MGFYKNPTWTGIFFIAWAMSLFMAFGPADYLAGASFINGA